jgi:hypothetical protein
MKTGGGVRSLTLGGLAALLAGAGAAPALPVPIAIESPLPYATVDCMIDGIAARCELDTGDMATATLVASPAFAKLPVIATKHVMGAAGVVAPSDVVKVGAIRVGDFEMKQPTDVFRNATSTPWPRLGRGFFEAMQTVTFNFQSMILTRDPPAGGICPKPFHVDGVIEVPVSFNGQDMQAVWDTGATMTVVSADFVASHPDQFQYVKDMTRSDDAIAASSMKAKMYMMNGFALCGHRADMPVVAIDFTAMKARAPKLPDIILGDSLFMGHVWSFDFRDGRWSAN